MNDQSLSTALQGLFTEHIGIGLVEIGDPKALATERELEALGQVVSRRSEEFSAGRAAARQALSGMGLPPSDILIGSHRQPLPPAGTVLSISHDRQFALALAAPAEHWLGLGIDIGEADALQADLISAVCTEQDLRDLARGESIAERAKLVFCLKEALFKAIFPQVGQWMEFSQSTLAIDHARGRYEAVFYSPDGAELPLLGCWTGRFVKVGNRWLAAAGMCRT